MKKLLFIILSIVLLIACDNDEENLHDKEQFSIGVYSRDKLKFDAVIKYSVFVSTYNNKDTLHYTESVKDINGWVTGVELKGPNDVFTIKIEATANDFDLVVDSNLREEKRYILKTGETFTLKR